MPIYEYKCEETNNVYEVQQSIKAEPLEYCTLENCACNGKSKVHRLISKNVGLIFNGSGFYQTDYKNSENKEINHQHHQAACSCCQAAKTCPASPNNN